MFKVRFVFTTLLTAAVFILMNCAGNSSSSHNAGGNAMNEGKSVIQRKAGLPKGSREIWLAGGCFWGMEKYMAGIQGVLATSVGYANGIYANGIHADGTAVSPTYEQVCTGTTGCAETVHVVYNPEKLHLTRLLELYMQAIEPTSLDRQGYDVGTQYRTGIYYGDKADLPVIQAVIDETQAQYSDPVVVEVKPVESYYLAEDYHQEYLKKNPDGYCHISDELCVSAWNAR